MIRGILLAIIVGGSGLRAFPVQAQVGEVRVSAGAMTTSGFGGGRVKPVTVASFSFVISRFSLGPEVFYAFGEEHIFGIGAVARLRLSSSRVAAFLIGGLGGNFWKGDEFVTAGLFTGNLGAGLSLDGPGNMAVTLEGRLHKSLQHYSGVGNWDFASITAGLRLGW
jgi:hypothetical protein